MKQFLLYCVCLLFPVFFYTSEAGISVQTPDQEPESEEVCPTNDYFSSFYHLFNRNCGEFVLDLTHFSPHVKHCVRIQTHGGENRKVFFRASMSDGCISYFSLPAVNSYYIYGLHKIVV